MKKEDIEFRKNCQLYHTKIRALLRKGQIDEAQEIIKNIGASLQAWEDFMRSARVKIHILKSLFTEATIEERTFIKKG